jgi:endonuclease G
MVAEKMQDRLEAIARARVSKNKSQIEHSLRQIAAGNPLGAETVEARMIDRIATKSGLGARDARSMTNMIAYMAAKVEGAKKRAGPEATQGPTIDFVGVEFLTLARLAANAVGRVAFRDGRAQGTGFLVAPGLFLTNNHVIESPSAARQMVVEFDFEADQLGREIQSSVFSFDSAQCFVFDPIEKLDFTLIAIGERLRGSKFIESFGYLPLSDASDKHMLGEIANIIQHPLGRLKQIVVRENSLVARDETVQVLHYLADTEKGSSGSPVCNNEWEPIALHHWGGPSLELNGSDGRPLRQDINEGIRISAIVRALRNKSLKLATPTKRRVEEALLLWGNMKNRGPMSAERVGTFDTTNNTREQRSAGAVLNSDSVSWIFPIEISVRAPLIDGIRAAPKVSSATIEEPGAERKSDSKDNFSKRGGYESGFIPGFVVPFPSLKKVGYRLAKNKMAASNEGMHELRYHHFSIVMNAERRLAAVTACNIDGARTVSINRRDKTVNVEPTLNDLGVEALGPEKSDDFRPDPRVLDDEQMTREFYDEQVVPGFPKPPFPGREAPKSARSAYSKKMNQRTARMFQKGHIIMRGDPAWGHEDEALAAEEDTFFYTNAAPQLGFFNQGSAEDQPGSKGKLRWRALETFILRNAFTMRQRICVFAGPIFDDKYDIEYRQGILVPMRFWKIAVWAEGTKLRSIALIADQKPVLDRLTKGVPEAFTDSDELSRVSEFLTTVVDVERRTGLDFGSGVREADVRAGKASLEPAIDATDSIIASKPQRTKPTP